MSTLVGVRELSELRELPLSKPLDEASWHAWVLRGRARDRRDSAVRVMAVKCISIAALFAVAVLWSHLAPYYVVARFILAAGALVMMFHAFRTRHYAFAAVFGALALLYNPAVPVFGFVGDWQRALVAASSAPFLASLGWGDGGRKQHD